MMDYLTNSPFNSHFIQQKRIHVLVLLEYNTRQKKKKHQSLERVTPGFTHVLVLIPHAVPYAGQTPAPDKHLKGGPTTG